MTLPNSISPVSLIFKTYARSFECLRYSCHTLVVPCMCFPHLLLSTYAFDHTLIALMSFGRTGYSFANDAALQFVERMQVLFISTAEIATAALEIITAKATSSTTSCMPSCTTKLVLTFIQSTHCNRSIIYPCFTWALGAEFAHAYQGPL